MLTLVGANLNYSSWTMRAWLALRVTGLPFRFHDVRLRTSEGWKERILDFSGAGKVPVLVDGASTVHESLAIGERLNELAPDARLWPDEPLLRARGRSLACEMLSSFSALRTELPCNLRARSRTPKLSPAAEADVARVEDIFTASLDGGEGPFLLGAFSLADAMYAPVAMRFRTYRVPVAATAQRYVETVLSHPAVLALSEIAMEQPAIPEYDAALLTER